MRILLISCLVLVCSCKRNCDHIGEPVLNSAGEFTEHRIPAGEHYSLSSIYSPVVYEELNFEVKFDSSAVYTTKDLNNQFDINKLYGFSDNQVHHHVFSARIGWRWSDAHLRLFAYVYNNGELNYKEITTISIGEVHQCTIKITGASYFFSVNEKTVTMSRGNMEAKAVGYKLFPYFGGDETAPHEITIRIKEK